MAEELTLADFGLEPELDCRWKQNDSEDKTGTSWSYGKARKVERDGSIGLIDARNGGSRSIRVERLYKKTKGPRGAILWVKVSDGPETSD